MKKNTTTKKATAKKTVKKSVTKVTPKKPVTKTPAVKTPVKKTPVKLVVKKAAPKVETPMPPKDFKTPLAGKPLSMLVNDDEKKFVLKLNVKPDDYTYIHRMLTLARIPTLYMMSCDSWEKNMTGLAIFVKSKANILKVVPVLNQMSPNWVRATQFTPASQIKMK